MPASIPPWIKRPSEKRLWVPAALAAREYFRKSHEHVVRQCKSGDLDGIFQTYFDGFRWWIRLPEPLPKSALSKAEKSLILLTQQ